MIFVYGTAEYNSSSQGRFNLQGRRSRSGGVLQVRAEDGGGFERPCGGARVGEGVATNHDRR